MVNGLGLRQIVLRFLEGERGMGPSLATDGTTVWSYMVPVARREGRHVTLFRVLPTRTTRMHRELVRRLSEAAGFTVTEGHQGV